MPLSQSAIADPQFSQQIQQAGGWEHVWKMLEASVAEAIENQYQQVQAEMDGDGLGEDPNDLPRMLVNLDPHKALNLLHQQNPNLNLLASLLANPLEVTSAVIGMLVDSN